MYYNFKDNSTDMNIQALNALNELMKIYYPTESYHINDSSRRRILGKGVFKCRFCGKSKPEVKFGKAHAIPHCIGNNVLFTHRECDRCNLKFGQRLENEFANFMNLDHTVSGVRGKKGYPKFSVESIIETTDSLVEWENVPDENLEYNQATGTLKIKQKMQTFIPLAVFKCLIRIAITIMPEEDIIDFFDTIRWLNNETHQSEDFTPKHLWLIHGKSCSINRFSELSAILLKKNTNSPANMPHMMLRLTYSNFLFQVPIPFCKKDDSSLKLNIPYIPSLLDLEHGFGHMDLKLLDMHSSEPIKGMIMNFTIEDLDGNSTYEIVAS